jgi:hypothetical protein
MLLATAGYKLDEDEEHTAAPDMMAYQDEFRRISPGHLAIRGES